MDEEKWKGMGRFLLERGFILSAFELFHELLENDMASAASELDVYFGNHSLFPPEKLRELRDESVPSFEKLVTEKDEAIARLVEVEQDLRSANDELLSLRILKKGPGEPNGNVRQNSALDLDAASGSEVSWDLLDVERQVLNIAVKDYLLRTGYKATAAAFGTEVGDGRIDSWQGSSEDEPLLVTYYRAFTSSTADESKPFVEEANDGNPATIPSQMEARLEEQSDIITSLKAELAEKEKKIAASTISHSETVEEVSKLRQTVAHLRAESEQWHASADAALARQVAAEKDAGEAAVRIEELRKELEKAFQAHNDTEAVRPAADHNSLQTTPPAADSCSDKMAAPQAGTVDGKQVVDEKPPAIPSPDAPAANSWTEGSRESATEARAVEIIAQSLPNIIPNVLINKRDELLPLLLCAIENHPNPSERLSLTRSLFNLIKRPDADQRKMIMGACTSLAAKLGEQRTQAELLPQCWEQISHKFEERRILVAQSCGQLAPFVAPSLRSSLILSSLHQLMDDSSVSVRQHVTQNLSLLLPLMPQQDNNYEKVEEVLFHLVCDPVGEVVEDCLTFLLPAFLRFMESIQCPLVSLLTHLLYRMASTVQFCPPISGVEGSPESRLRVLGESERWSTDALLRMLMPLLLTLSHSSKKKHPQSDNLKGRMGEGIHGLKGTALLDYINSSTSQQQQQQQSASSFAEIDWVVGECLPALLRLSTMLSPREEALRQRLMQVLMACCENFGADVSALLILPVVQAAAGYPVHPRQFPKHLLPNLEGIVPVGSAGERLARMCVLPLLLAGVLGSPSLCETHLANYFRELVLSTCLSSGPWSERETPDLIDAVRFLCTQTQHHDCILSVLWELVVNPTPSVRVTAALLFQPLCTYVDVQRLSQRVMPALITLGTDASVDVKHASISSFGAVAVHCTDSTVVEKVRIQMESFLEEGSQEGTVAVIRSLTAAVPVTTDSLKNFLLQRLLLLTATSPSSVERRRERAEAMSAAVKALDGTDLSVSSIQNYLLPVVQSLLKEPGLLSGSSRECLDAILRERGGGMRLEALGKAMGKSLFGDGGLFSKKESQQEVSAESLFSGTPVGSTAVITEESKLRKMMRLKYEEMLKGSRSHR